MHKLLTAIVLTFLFSAPAHAAYTGFFLTTQNCAQNREVHWQCDPVLWKAAAEVLPTDYVATCPTLSGIVCGTRQRWMLQTTLQPNTYVLSCTGMPSSPTNKGGCTNPLSAWYVQLIPTPPVIPPCAANAVCFYNVTTSVIPEAPQVPMHFWAGLPDLNNDGCLDIFIGKHANATTSAMYIHDKAADRCAGTFTYVPETDSNYTQIENEVLRSTSRYLFGNWYNDKTGLWSFYGHDADAPPSARYVATRVVNNIPQYAPKTTGCPSSSCVPIELDGDGVFQLVTRVRTDDGMARIRNIETGAVEITPDPAGTSVYGPIAVFDVDNNGYPDIVHPTNRGYWTYASGALTWQANKFPADGISPLAGSGHMVPLDYDSDGDMDLYFGAATYSGLTGNTVQGVIKGPNTFYVRMYRNDRGSFSDVTTAAGLTQGLLKNTTYWTGYANTVAGDVDNDGDPDLVMAGEARSHTTASSSVTIIRNNGNGTFTIDRTNNFGGFTSAANTSARPWLNLGDFNNDGDLDLVKTHGASSPLHESVGLFRNISANTNHWLRIRVQGKTTDGLHTRIVIKDAASNAIVTSGQISAFTESYQNLIPHFGVGNRTTVNLEIHRPHGLPVQTFPGIAVDRDIIIRADNTLETYIPGKPPLGETKPLNYVTTEVGKQYFITVSGVQTSEYPSKEAAEQAAKDVLAADNNAMVGVDEVIHSTVEIVGGVE